MNKFLVFVFVGLAGCASTKLAPTVCPGDVHTRSFRECVDQLISSAKVADGSIANINIETFFDKGGLYQVANTDLRDEKHPVKIIAWNKDLPPMKRGYEWNIAVWYISNQIACVTTFKTDDEHISRYVRQNVLSYLKESQTDDCKVWRRWATNTNYSALVENSPNISTADIMTYARDKYASEFSKHNDLGVLKEMARSDLLISNGTPLPTETGVESDMVPFLRHRNSLIEHIARLTRENAESYVDEASRSIAQKKKKLKDVADEQRRIAERKARVERERIEAETLRKNQQADKRMIDTIKTEIQAWEKQHSRSLEIIANSDDPLSTLIGIARTDNLPRVEELLEKLILPESSSQFATISSRLRQIRKINWKDITEKTGREKAKAIYSIKCYCDLINESWPNASQYKIWETIRGYCEEEERLRFLKKFEIQDGNCPSKVWATVVSVPFLNGTEELCIDDESYFFYRPQHDKSHIIARNKSYAATKNIGTESENSTEAKNMALADLFENSNGTIRGSNSLSSIFGVEFGAVIRKDLKQTEKTDSGLLLYKFAPKKKFLNFTEYVAFASPATRRVVMVCAKGSIDEQETYTVDQIQKQVDKVVRILEEKYKRTAVEKNDLKMITFNGAQYITVQLTELGDINIMAMDKGLYAEAIKEAKQMERQTLMQENSSDLDAL